jgi:hypothetical protein
MTCSANPQGFLVKSSSIGPFAFDHSSSAAATLDCVVGNSLPVCTSTIPSGSRKYTGTMSGSKSLAIKVKQEAANLSAWNDDRCDKSTRTVLVVWPGRSGLEETVAWRLKQVRQEIERSKSAIRQLKKHDIRRTSRQHYYRQHIDISDLWADSRQSHSRSHGRAVGGASVPRTRRASWTRNAGPWLGFGWGCWLLAVSGLGLLALVALAVLADSLCCFLLASFSCNLRPI